MGEKRGPYRQSTKTPHKEVELLPDTKELEDINRGYRVFMSMYGHRPQFNPWKKKGVVEDPEGGKNI